MEGSGVAGERDPWHRLDMNTRKVCSKKRFPFLLICENSLCIKGIGGGLIPMRCLLNSCPFEIIGIRTCAMPFFPLPLSVSGEKSESSLLLCLS